MLYSEKRISYSPDSDFAEVREIGKIDLYYSYHKCELEAHQQDINYYQMIKL